MANHAPEFTQNRISASVANLNELAANLEHPFQGLDYSKSQVLLLASYGGTVEDVSKALDVGKPYIEKTRDFLIEKFEVPNMAAVVNNAIRGQILPVEVNNSSRIERSLTRRGVEVLGMFAVGMSNREIAQELGKSVNYLARYINRPLFKTLKASGRTHSVRRSYELGIFTLAS